MMRMIQKVQKKKPNNSTDNLCNQKEDYLNKLKVTNNKDIDDEYKY